MPVVSCGVVRPFGRADLPRPVVHTPDVHRPGAPAPPAPPTGVHSIGAPQIADSAVVYPETVLGNGTTVADMAVVGKKPSLSVRSTTKRTGLEPAEIGEGTIVSTGAIVFAGTKIGKRVIIGDQACIRERVTIGDDVVIGRGVLVENDSKIGAGTKIQANAYITNYSTVEEQVFIAPGVLTTNDNFMGRTERRHALIKGPTIRRGARVGGGAVLCPAVEVGEEAYVGAGAVVTKDVPARKVVVGNPARVLREVPEDELLDWPQQQIESRHHGRGR
jgi:acetyltransferase-like isoleucine patch superfamily enzyme